MRRKLLSLCLIALIFLMMPCAALAADFSAARKGSISVDLKDPDGVSPIVGAEFSLYYVATVGRNSSYNLAYVINDEYKEDIDLNDPDLLNNLDKFVREKEDLPSEKRVTDSQGNIFYDQLPTGLYFVKQDNAVEGYAPCSSFLVTLPEKTDNGYNYAINASPKTDVVRLTDITIKKVWNTDSYSKIADSVMVQLLKDDVVLETALLNAENDWQIVYEDMPESDGYSILEINVPKGFKATYSRNAYEFTVTNSSSLAQTGQLVWPVPVLAMIGLIFITAGMVIIRKSRDGNA